MLHENSASWTSIGIYFCFRRWWGFSCSPASLLSVFRKQTVWTDVLLEFPPTPSLCRGSTNRSPLLRSSCSSRISGGRFGDHPRSRFYFFHFSSFWEKWVWTRCQKRDLPWLPLWKPRCRFRQPSSFPLGRTEIRYVWRWLRFRRKGSGRFSTQWCLERRGLPLLLWFWCLRFCLPCIRMGIL